MHGGASQRVQVCTPNSNLVPQYYYVPGASFWEAYMMLSFKPVGMKSYIRTLVCSTGETILQSTDISLQRMVNDLKDSAAASPYRSFLFAIELGATPDKDIMMADSLDTNYMIYTDRAKGRARPLLLSETRTAYMTEPYFNATTYVEGHDLARDLYDYVASTAEGSVEKLNTQLGGETAVVKLRSVPYFLRVDLLLRPQTGVRQAIIMLVDRNHVMADLTQSNKKAIGIIAGVVAAGVGLAVAFSLMLANALYKITKDLKLLSKFKFTEVLRPLDKEGTVKKARFSRINELWQIQQAFHQMTVNFASAVSQNKRFGDATQAHRRTTLNGPVGASGVMSDSEV
ncbi:hypothetical protein DFJ77DRAFT_82682 [Powellomyces hirtus]|nr:hypothetical protein DFJ77DRAFT_82682 [Powellomyces hirtus]